MAPTTIFIWKYFIIFGIYINTYCGVVTFAPSQVMLLQKLLKYYVCLFLIIRFNPLIKTKNNSQKDIEFDRKIAFSAGIFLLLTTTITDIIYNTIVDIV